MIKIPQVILGFLTNLYNRDYLNSLMNNHYDKKYNIQITLVTKDI